MPLLSSAPFRSFMPSPPLPPPPPGLCLRPRLCLRLCPHFCPRLGEFHLFLHRHGLRPWPRLRSHWLQWRDMPLHPSQLTSHAHTHFLAYEELKFACLSLEPRPLSCLSCLEERIQPHTRGTYPASPRAQTQPPRRHPSTRFIFIRNTPKNTTTGSFIL